MKDHSDEQRAARFAKFLQEKGGAEKITSKEIEEWFSLENSRNQRRSQKTESSPDSQNDDGSY